MKRIPKLRYFKTHANAEAYAVKNTYVADEMMVAMSELYHRMNPENEILVEGKEYTNDILPYAYFKYKNKIWPVYDDDAGQQDCIYLEGRFIGAGAYNGYPGSVDYFMYEIDSYLKRSK